MRLRSTLSRSARTLGDVKAVTSGRIAQRAANRAMGRAYGRTVGGGCAFPMFVVAMASFYVTVALVVQYHVRNVMVTPLEPGWRLAMSRWQPAPNAEMIPGNTGTTYKIVHNGQETRVRYRTDREQIEFWAAGRWVAVWMQANDDGAGVHVVPREAGE